MSLHILQGEINTFQALLKLHNDCVSIYILPHIFPELGEKLTHFSHCYIMTLYQLRRLCEVDDYELIRTGEKSAMVCKVSQHFGWMD
jgi:hypothetical protein